MTDGQLAWKATKVAAVVFGGLVAFIFLMVGMTVLAFALLGKAGAALLYLALLFGIIWFCAALDVHGQEERAASAMSASGQDPEEGLEAKPASATGEAGDAQPSGPILPKKER